MKEPEDEPTPVEPDGESEPEWESPRVTPDYWHNVPQHLGISREVADLLFVTAGLAGLVGYFLIGKWAINEPPPTPVNFVILSLVATVIGAVVVWTLWRRSRLHGRTVGGSISAGVISGGCAVVLTLLGIGLLIAGACSVMASGV